MPRINLKGAVVDYETKDCRGEGCPIQYCKRLKRASNNKCLGYRDKLVVNGVEWTPWRCEYAKQ